MAEGIIVKLVSGQYTVRQEDGSLLECRARGSFRYLSIQPVVGDRVETEPTEPGKGYILSVRERRNSLVRPPVANIDRLCVVTSVCDPAPSFQVIDKLIVLAESQGIEPVLVITKTDRGDAAFLSEVYRKAGFPVCEVANEAGTDEVKALLQGKTTVLCGNTGVGKSSLLNRICPGLELAVGETSRKLGRGRHTTRHVELFELPEGGFVADTPGFSAVELESCSVVFKEELAGCFREFAPYVDKCRFTGCSHRTEKGCAVLEAVAAGDIPKQRHADYVFLYNEAAKLNEWEFSDRKNNKK